MADDKNTKRKLPGNLVQALEHYHSQTLVAIRAIYDKLTPYADNKWIIAHCNIETEYRKVLDLERDIQEMLYKRNGESSAITSICSQIKQVNRSLEYIQKDQVSTNILKESVNISTLNQLIIDNHSMLNQIENFNSSSTSRLFDFSQLPKTPGEIGMGILYKALPQAIPFIAAGAWVAGKIKSALETDRTKYRPKSAEEGTVSTPVPTPPTPADADAFKFRPGKPIADEEGTVSTPVPTPPTPADADAFKFRPGKPIAEGSNIGVSEGPKLTLSDDTLKAPIEKGEKLAKEKSVAPATERIVEKTIPAPAPASTISEKSSSPVNISQALERDREKPFMRKGQLYQPERNALGQFTGGGVSKETSTEEDVDAKSRTIAEESEQEGIHEGLVKFFSRSAYDSRWTAELLSTVKGLSPVLGEDKEKGENAPKASLMQRIKNFFEGENAPKASLMQRIKNFFGGGGGIGKVGGLAEGAGAAGGIAEGAGTAAGGGGLAAAAAGGIAEGAGTAAGGGGLAAAAAGGIAEGAGTAAGGGGLAAAALPVLAVLAAGAGGAMLGTFINEKMGLGKVIQGAVGEHPGKKESMAKAAQSSTNPVLQRSMELQATGMSSKESMAEAMKEKGTPKEQAQFASRESGDASKPLGGAPTAENQPRLEKVPIDTVFANIQQQTKDGMDKLHTAMLEISNILKEAGKSTSKKNPSGYDATNTRNPVLSSLGAGQLDIS